MRNASAIVAMILLLFGSVLAYGPSTDVYWTEDELDEALATGEIDSCQFMILQEIKTSGIDSNNQHLLDEIPNLDFFAEHLHTLSTPLEKEQLAAFSRNVLTSASGTFRYQYSQYLEDNPDSRYRSFASLSLTEHWRISFKVHREYSGLERFVTRTVSYQNRHGRLREIKLGNNSKRLGLGTMFGYRGKLLNFADNIDGESFLFPDYGGYNGLYGRIEAGKTQVQLLGSVNRDSDFRLVTAAGMVSFNKGILQPGIIVGVNRLSNRQTRSIIHDIKYGFSLRYNYSAGYTVVEAVGQSGFQSSPGGIALEGRHRFSTAQIKYAGWGYSDHYIDLSGGSKTGNLRRSMTLDDIEFETNGKRTGQEGGLIKTIVLLTSHTSLINSFQYAGVNRDSVNIDMLSALERDLHPGVVMRLDHLYRTKKRIRSEGIDDQIVRRTRIELQITYGNLSTRSYIGHNIESEQPDFLSFFTRVVYKSRLLGQFELLSNLARFYPNEEVVDYWYMYVKNERNLWDDITMAIKLKHTFRRESGDRHRTIFTLELGARL